MSSRRVLVCGGRNFSNFKKLSSVLDYEHRVHRFSVVIHGNARGADALAARWAYSTAVPVESYIADWSLNGKSAGPIRNELMLTSGRPDAMIAFPGGRGTADMIRRARAAGVAVIEIA